MSIFILLLFLVSSLLAQHEYPFPSSVEPLASYDVLLYDFRYWRVNLDPSLSYEVEQVIKLVLLEPTERLVFDCVGLNVHSCFSCPDSSLLSFFQDDRSLVIDLGQEFLPGETLSVMISYTGYANTSFYSTRTRYGERIYYTLCFASTARYIFPCVDHPLDKALFNLTIYVPFGYIVASNGELIWERDDSTTYACEYRSSFPMATYLFTIHIFPYEIWHRTSFDGIPIVVYYYPRDRGNVFSDFNRLPEILDFYKDLFGQYPFEKVGYAIAPVFAGYGAMENQTMITFGDRLINGRRTYESVIAHELSHQWFGDAVSIADWRDFWLNEGFAQYAELLFIERFYPDQFRSSINSLHQDFFNAEPREGRFPLYDPEVYLGYTVYYKGASVMHMLRYVMGDSLFFRALQEYYYRFRYRNVTTDSFRVVCEEVSGLDLDWFFYQWVYQQGYPELEYYFRNIGDTTRIFIRQVQRDAPPRFILPLEIMLTGERERYVFHVWISDSFETLSVVSWFEVLDVTLDPNEWLLAKFTRTTDVQDTPQNLPEFELFAYPNPFNEKIRIVFGSHLFGEYLITLSDINGRVIRRFSFNSDRCELVWDGTDERGVRVSSGLYFLVIEGSHMKAKKSIVLLR